MDYTKKILKHLKDYEQLDNIDNVLIGKAAYALEKLENIEKQLNGTKMDGTVEEARIITNYDKFMNRFLTICMHLGMSPNARIKLKWHKKEPSRKPHPLINY